ncbi:endolytic transglycosylase MltG [Patescibacteria group bacterium]|nr:endolytic transglycosylase MltG [Patescibacteria group bacterium]MBU4401005.1 endolytic transglycosylase MltG [Planctomycetota bacterium]MCG2699817.1 endolytic transglycosylase MltG [Candidatus Parcubacteria bacterium]MBU4274857.1 endolytic transglycosylase MltG [Patescibacteria group bacterium]MBU4367974.1 endolytic transglycosylase MltG [Patescibacteria group bacterium]
MNKNIILLLVLICFISGIFLWSDIYLPPEPGSNKIVNFTVEKGQGAKEISIKLKSEGLIKHSSIFRTYVLLRGLSKKLQAGQYELSPSISMSNIVKKLSRGEIIKEKITIIEGWNLKNIAQYFQDNNISSQEEFLELAKKDFSQGLSVLSDKPKDLNLEGYLFPDTYEIIPGTGAENIIKKMLNNLDQKITLDLRQEIIQQEKSIFEIITMASLIEKEVRTLEDKKIVSGIFWKRIESNKPLESCATISYILGVNKWIYSFDDTRIPSPYNTYLNQGLPLGPISNPGLDSITAAIYPTETDYFYYLSAPDGRTIFSKTYKEHNAAKVKYLK